MSNCVVPISNLWSFKADDYGPGSSVEIEHDLVVKSPEIPKLFSATLQNPMKVDFRSLMYFSNVIVYIFWGYAYPSGKSAYFLEVKQTVCLFIFYAVFKSGYPAPKNMYEVYSRHFRIPSRPRLHMAVLKRNIEERFAGCRWRGSYRLLNNFEILTRSEIYSLNIRRSKNLTRHFETRTVTEI